MTTCPRCSGSALTGDTCPACGLDLAAARREFARLMQPSATWDHGQKVVVFRPPDPLVRTLAPGGLRLELRLSAEAIIRALRGSS